MIAKVRRQNSTKKTNDNADVNDSMRCICMKYFMLVFVIDQQGFHIVVSHINTFPGIQFSGNRYKLVLLVALNFFSTIPPKCFTSSLQLRQLFVYGVLK